MTDQIKVSYKFTDVSPVDQAFAKDIVQKNLDGKMDSYLKKVTKDNADAQVRIEYTIKYHEESKKYDANFLFLYDGKEFVWKKEGFKILADLVNHAFVHFKEVLSHKTTLKKEKAIKK